MRKPPTWKALAQWAPLAAILSILALALTAWVLRGQGDDAVVGFRTLWRNAWWALPVALALHVAVQALAAVRFRMVAQALGIPVSPWQAQQVVTSGLFAAAATPMRAGAEPLRAALLRRDGMPWSSVGQLLVADRLFDVVAYLVLGTAAALLYPQLADGGSLLYWAAWIGLSILVAAATCLLLLLAWPALGARPTDWAWGQWDRIRGRIRVDRTVAIVGATRNARDELRLLQKRPGTVVAGLAITVAMRASEAAVMFVLLWALGLYVNFFAVMMASVLLVLVALVPLAPGGAGVVEPAAILLLAPLAPGIGAAFLITWRALTFHFDLVAGAFVAGSALRARPRFPPAPS